MKAFRFSTFLALSILAVLPAFADETVVHGAPVQTYVIASSTSLLDINPTYGSWAVTQGNAYVACPSSPDKKACTFVVTLTMEVNGFTAANGNDTVAAGLYMDTTAKLPASTYPANPVGVDSTSGGGASNSRTVMWTITNVKSGTTHWVDALLWTTAGIATSSSRSLKVEVFQ